MITKEEIKQKIDQLSESELEKIYEYLSDLLDRKKEGIKIETFSFHKAQEATKSYKGSLSDTVIAERRKR
jgi:hypothetical protein